MMNTDPPAHRPFCWEESLTATWRPATGDSGIGGWSLEDTFVRREQAEGGTSLISNTEYDWLEIWIEEITVPPSVIMILCRAEDGLFDAFCNGKMEAGNPLTYEEMKDSLIEDSFFKVAGPISVVDGSLDRYAALR